MSKFYNDYHGHARFDPTHDNRHWKRDIKSKAIRLVLDTAQEMQIKTMIANKVSGGNVREPLDTLLLISGLRQKLEALNA